MNLRAIIEDIADQADDFLEGVASRDQARAAISEIITLHYAQLSGTERTAVIGGVMTILEEEGFFEDFPGSGRAGNDSDLDDASDN